MISIKQLENIISDIISDKEWVNDSESAAEYKGVVAGLEQLYKHIQELKQNRMSVKQLKQDLIYDVVDYIKFDLLNGDEEAIYELLNFIPNKNLIWFLPEKHWKKYQSLNQNKNEG